MTIFTNETSSNIMHYFSIYIKNLALGYNVGAATIGSTIINPPEVYKSPFLNRFMELGAYNALQDQLFARINVDNKGDVDNFACLGLIQTAKYLPNIIVQNALKDNLYSKKSNTLYDTTSKNFLITSTGMLVFFTIGSITDKINNDLAKMTFASSILGITLAGYILTAPKFSLKNPMDSIYFSFNGAGLVSLGLMSSFIIPNIMHEIGIDKGKAYELDTPFLLKTSIVTFSAIASGFNPIAISLSISAAEIFVESMKETEILGFSLVNTLLVTESAIAQTIISGNILSSLTKIAAFSFAKANAVTGVEWLNNNKEDICSYLEINKECEYLGITTHQADNSYENHS